MPRDDQFLKILEILSDVRERTARIESEQANIKEDLVEVKRQDEVQNKLLAEHIKGVETQALRLDNEIKYREAFQATQDDLKSRVSKLEEPSKFLTAGKKYLIWIAGVGGAVAAIIKWFQS